MADRQNNTPEDAEEIARSTLPRWLTPEQTAERLHVSESTLATWRSTKRWPLAFHKIGNLILYDIVDVDSFVRSHRDACGAIAAEGTPT